MWRSWGNSGKTSYSGMMAPPGNPKMVDTPSSTSDWQIALAPFKRIDVLTSAERTIALAPISLEKPFDGDTKNPASPTEPRSSDPRGTTLLAHIVPALSLRPVRGHS